jgi:membrane fusion protein, multidrug efflux system
MRQRSWLYDCGPTIGEPRMTASPQPRRRRRTLIVLLLLMLLGAGSGTTWYLQQGQWRETTDNAYLGGNLVVVSSLVTGTVVGIGAEENDRVGAGAELLRLGDADALQELELRKHELALAVQDVIALRAQSERAAAELALREITHRLARDEFDRRKQLAQRRMLSDEELDAARARAEETAGALQTARHALQESRIRGGQGTVAQHPTVNAAAARLHTAYRDWRKARIVSPVSGQVARRRVQLGQRVEPGTPLFSIAQHGSAWVEANFKENQLRHMRPGQPVRMSSDLYGEELVLHGHIESIGAGTGSVFAILPPQNATGNWIKIVQRVPVRIALERQPDESLPLPLGASLHVRVDTRERSAARQPTAAPRAVHQAEDLYAYQSAGADAMIAAIIRAHGG